MAWITPTLQQCKDRIPKEWPALSNAARTTGQDADVLAGTVITDQVNRIRGRVKPGVPRGAEGTIPDEMMTAFLALWVHAFITKLPSMKQFLDAERVSAYKDALDEMEQLALGRIYLVPPTTAAPDNQQAVASTVAVVSKTTRRNTRENMGGML
jgi:hypothetical protein